MHLPTHAHTVTKLPKPAPRDSLRMGLPSKGRMAEDTLQLLKVRWLRVCVVRVGLCCTALLWCALGGGRFAWERAPRRTAAPRCQPSSLPPPLPPRTCKPTAAAT